MSCFWKKFAKWLEEYQKELILLLIAAGLTLSVQLIGCNDQVVLNYSPPTSCDDFDLSGLEDASCEDVSVDTERDFDAAGNFPGEFSGADSGSPGEIRPAEPRSQGANSYMTVTATYNMGVVDIIFVIDNSRSMHVEQRNIANQFDQFLDDIQYLDYRIAIMTVDISDSPDNRDRTYQDGHFIRFKNGRKYISNEQGSQSEHRKNIKMFRESVQRPESIECMEPGKADLCPDDERAICALNKSLDISSQRDFFRPHSHLMVVILSDEDERSSEEYREQQWALNRTDYRLRSCDDPRNFYSKVAQRIGLNTGISVHAIIIPPGDDDCLAEQDEELGQGYYGEVYEDFAEPSSSIVREYPYITRGRVLSICDRDYGSQLGQLSDYLQRPLPITLSCEPYRVENVRLVDEDGGSEKVKYELDGKNLTITEDRVSLSSQIRLTVFCPKE